MNDNMEVKPATQILTGTDAMISGVVSRTPVDVPVGRISTDEKVDLFKLPDECLKGDISKKYRFKWVGKTEKQLNRALEIEGWILCTRQNAAFIPASYFKVHGAIEKSGMLLAFMSVDNAEARNKRYRDKHNARKKMLDDMKRKPNHYEAKLSKSEEEGSAEERDAHRQGRDF